MFGEYSVTCWHTLLGSKFLYTWIRVLLPLLKLWGLRLLFEAARLPIKRDIFLLYLQPQKKMHLSKSGCALISFFLSPRRKNSVSLFRGLFEGKWGEEVATIFSLWNQERRKKSRERAGNLGKWDGRKRAEEIFKWGKKWWQKEMS